MQHENCINAINFMTQHPELSTNVDKDKDNVSCSHQKTPCDWVGNDIHYACLIHESKHPQKVYTHLNAGGHGQIINNKMNSDT